ncbi:nitroreductase family protein [Echinicola jeungdonensis]|uniref:Nitroreductase family protein n=1 Tax=Echinicola jeungdonensis TaxID=709343 RepID=A0ABV5J3G8_9BACT|nr:nitroreductase family protein [Echinicola jeungdonensis]MDN3669629.1 nitroreductase family protein [Echinicola jeungdonensis]
MALIDNLNWRYAAKRMNGDKVPESSVDKILESIQLAPTSYGLQPFVVFVVEDKALREKLQPAVWGQPQVAEGSHLLVFAAWKEVTEERIDRYIGHISDKREQSLEKLQALGDKIKSRFAEKSKEDHFVWASRQAYLALGTALVAAAEEKVDSTPMEGFFAEDVDQILELEDKGLGSVALMVLGFRDEEKDLMNKAKKVRRPKEEMFFKI